MKRRVAWLVFVFWTFAIGRVFADPSSSREFDRGLKAYDARQYTTAFNIWSKIKNENLAALRNVAIMLRKGQGVKKDPKKAQGLFEIAANAGMPNAEVDLAEMLLNGEAGPPNTRRAQSLLQDAASSQHPVAEYLLGQMYEAGNGVPKDANKAVELYIAAARGGLKDAKERLAAIGETPRQTPSKPARAIVAAVPPASASRTPSKPVSVFATAPLPPAPAHQAASTTSIAENSGAGAYALQIGSFNSVASAEAAWNRAHRKELLVSAFHHVKQVDLGEKGTWYRLLLGGFKDYSAATTFCDRLKAVGELCLVIRSDA
jgi:uncharacterized protein